MCVVVSYLKYEPVKYKKVSEQELRYSMCVKYKKDLSENHKKHKEPGYLLHPKWAFYPQLYID